MQKECDDSDDSDGENGSDWKDGAYGKDRSNGNCLFERKQNVAYHDGDLVNGQKNRVDSAEICEQQDLTALLFSYVLENYHDKYDRSCWLKNEVIKSIETTGKFLFFSNEKSSD